MRFKIKLPFLPPSVNHAYAVRGRGLYMKASAKQFVEEVRKLTEKQLRKQRFVKLPANEFFIMEVYFTFKNNRFPDPNNMLKILIDAFEGIVFENDKWLLPRVMNAKVTGTDSTTVVFKQKKK